MELIYIHQPVHKDQLRAIIHKCGFETSPDTFRNLTKDEYGQYSNIMLSVVGNKAVVLSRDEAEECMFRPERQDLHEVLGPIAISDVTISRVHPTSGMEAESGHAFLTCKLYGQMTAPMPIGKTLYDQYSRGMHTPLQIASGIFRDAMVQHFHCVTIKVDCGSRWTDGKYTIYHGETKGDGYHYKDLTAFDEKEGVCFICEANLNDYEQDLNDGKEIDMSMYGDTYEDLVGYARTLALRNPEKVARHAVERATYQSAFTELEEFYIFCEPEDKLTFEEELQDKLDWYIEEHGKQPNYAEVFIEYKDNRSSQRDMIALNPEAGEQADEEVFFTCSSFEDFKRLAAENNGEDFIVREIYGYHAGNMDGQKRTFDDAHIHDELEEAIRQAEQEEERIIEIDVEMTPKQLKDVLKKEGIKLLEVLPGIDEPLPLNKDDGKVAQVYLRVVCDAVIDWADDYMYRDAKALDTDPKITKLSHIVVSQEQLALELAQQANENDKLLHISDIRVYRNPQNSSSTEFRMRCRIDGVQQMGKVLTPAQVENLANGEDKTRMAAEVFAKELTSSLSRENQRGRGL